MQRAFLLLGLVIGVIGLVMFVQPEPPTSQGDTPEIKLEPLRPNATDLPAISMTRESTVQPSEVDVSAEGYVLSGRILNAEGMVASNLEFKVSIRVESDKSDVRYRRKLRTDASGNFHFPLERYMMLPATRTFAVAIRKTQTRPARGAQADFSWDPKDKVFALGDFVVDVFPVMVAGVVLDAYGDRVAAAKISVSRKGSQQRRWEPLPESMTYTDSRGNFEIKGSDAEGELLLEASCKGFLSFRRSVSVGDRGVRFALLQSLRVEGKVLLDPEFKASHFELQMVGDAGEISKAVLVDRWLSRSKGGYSFRKVPPGNVDLVLRHARTKIELYRWKEVFIPSGSKEVILPDLDARGILHQIKIKVKDEYGSFLKYASVRDLNGGVAQDGKKGIIHMIGRTPLFDLEISCVGKMTVQVLNLMQDETVVLQEGFPIQLRVNAFAGLSDEWDFYARLWKVDADGNPSGRKVETSYFETDGTITISLPWSGSTLVRFYLQRSSPRGPSVAVGADATDAQGQLFQVQIRNSAEVQTYSIPVEFLTLESTMKRSTNSKLHGLSLPSSIVY
ncbi:MAG: carboxypeptidase-like regulatory domain-containing protein [Planctomycetota bacterium]